MPRLSGHVRTAFRALELGGSLLLACKWWKGAVFGFFELLSPLWNNQGSGEKTMFCLEHSWNNVPPENYISFLDYITLLSGFPVRSVPRREENGAKARAVHVVTLHALQRITRRCRRCWKLFAGVLTDAPAHLAASGDAALQDDHVHAESFCKSCRMALSSRFHQSWFHHYRISITKIKTHEPKQAFRDL